jgi:thiosulfate reductase cytochrome b subunit
MAASTYAPALLTRTSGVPRHSTLVRVTHWINTLSFFGLLISGIAILIAHPRLYWGETGSVETASLIDLPIPFVLNGQNGWGRYLHFLSAWSCLLNSLFYVISGLFSGHFHRNLLPAKADLSWKSLTAILSDLRLKRRDTRESLSYNVHQRLAYVAVIFFLLPMMIWTGLAMSPAFTSVFPATVNVLGGQQSARTIHFFVAAALVLFLLVHVAMVYLDGFSSHVRAMITGRSAAREGKG